MTDTTSNSQVKQRVGDIAGMFLGSVLLFASFSKLIDPAAFVELVESEGLDFLFPGPVVAYIGIALEVGLGAALLLCIRRLPVLLLTTALVLFFVFLTGRAYVTGSDESCGCFGNLLDRTPAEAFWQDFALMVPALCLAYLGRRAGTGFPIVRAGAVVGLIGCALVFTGMAPNLPLDGLATRLDVGDEVAEICAGHGKDRECLDGWIPELAEGEHIVVLADVSDQQFCDTTQPMIDFVIESPDAWLWVLTSCAEEDRQCFHLEHGLQVREAPPGLMRSLYRRLPRSFRVRDGKVTETFDGLPPLGKWSQ